MPGAGGNKAAGYVYSVAPKDGTAIGALFPGGILAPLLGDTPIQHDPKKFILVGSANSDVYTCVTHTNSPIKSFKDAFTQEVIVGASNEGGTTRDMPTLSNNVLGTKFRIVTGYAGTREIALAVERKEIHGLCGLRLHQPALGDAAMAAPTKSCASSCRKTSRARPCSTSRACRARSTSPRPPEDRQVMELVYSQAVIGRPYVLPDGVPARARARRCARRSWPRSLIPLCWRRPRR
jgi:hypothetical protein